MRIHVFAEHYPNPYKPYYDTQLSQFLEDGHDVSVFTFGKHDATRNALIDRWGLDRRTTYLPWTLRDLPSWLPRLAHDLLRGPGAPMRSVSAARDDRLPLKRVLLDAVRALALPEQEPDVCLVHNLITAQSFGFLARWYPGARVALYFHGGELPDGRPIPERESRRVFGGVHRVFTNTASSRGELLRRGCEPEKISVLPVGFRLEDYPPDSPKPWMPDGVLRLVSVGRVSAEKGLDYALDAVAQLRARGIDRFRYRIVGAGTALAGLHERVRAERLERLVEFVGEVLHHALVDEYRRADVLLLPSVPTAHWAETQACVVQEAMLMGLLVIASRTGGVPESLAPEQQQRFGVEPRDSAGMARRIEELLGLGHGEARRLGEAGREFTAARYDIRTLNRRLLEEALGAPSRVAGLATACAEPGSAPSP
ncbi:MAG TPA: glycosyltransferase family 4 protein [Myxococcales bacterium]|jgi:glycosyltransferase involved in cell wall biosynthesis